MTEWVPRWDPGADAAATTLDGIDRWTSSPALSRLVSGFGGSPPHAVSTPELLAWLDGFSGEHWDFRSGRERNLASSAELTAAQEAAALALCPELGLAASRPSHSRYDTVIMTGGMVRAGLVKPRAVRALLDGGLSADSVVFLGAHRPFAGDEARLADALGVPGDDEVDAMVHGVERTFAPAGERTVSSGGDAHARWSTVSWPDAVAPSFTVVAAPSRPPAQRRANTADTLRHWAELNGGSARSVLLVTTPIYVPYQAACAVEVLGIEHGIAVETVGVDAAANDLGEHTQPFLAQHHLQELRSAIRGIRSLYSRLACGF